MKQDRNRYRCVAITHSKYRDAFGFVGVEVREGKLYVGYARQWKRKYLSQMAPDVSRYHKRFQWDVAYIDQLTGEHVIQSMRKDHKLNFRVITTQKNLKDPDGINRARVMDKIEMVQWMVQAKDLGLILFPVHPGHSMGELESQMEIFSEHKTEAGNVDYFAPGDEYDNLIKALMIACFAARKYMNTGNMRVIMGKKFASIHENEDSLSALTGSQIAVGKPYRMATEESWGNYTIK